MRIGTTPTHIFTVPFDTEQITAVEITYCQNGNVILQKYEHDCKMQGRVISVKLSQTDTFEFICGVNVEIQIRVLTTDDTAFASDIMRVSCEKCLSDEVLR